MSTSEIVFGGLISAFTGSIAALIGYFLNRKTERDRQNHEMQKLHKQHDQVRELRTLDRSLDRQAAAKDRAIAAAEEMIRNLLDLSAAATAMNSLMSNSGNGSEVVPFGWQSRVEQLNDAQIALIAYADTDLVKMLNKVNASFTILSQRFMTARVSATTAVESQKRILNAQFNEQCTELQFEIEGASAATREFLRNLSEIDDAG